MNKEKRGKTNTLNFSAGAAAVRAERTSRGYLLPRFSGITPRQVDWALRGYEEGEFRSCAPLMEAVARYDTQIAACIEKRFSMTAGADWEIQTEQDADESARALAETQSEILRDFFNTFTVSSATAQDEQQGISALVRHVISAVGYGYSAAALTWFPAKTPTGALTQHCAALTCPLRFFEARERRLRIRADYSAFSGEPLSGELWLVAHAQGTPLLLPTLFAYMFKSTPIEDWAHTVEKFGVPFVTAKTPAQYKSEEWLAAEEALRSVGTGFSGVFGKDVELEVHALAQGDAPHAAIIDYIDRSVSRLWLGGDLSTMSQTGAGSIGSQSQLGSEAFLRKTDRAFVEQVIDFGLVRPLLRRVFGGGARQLAYFKFKDAETKDVSASIQRLKTAREMRLPIAKAFAYAELGIAQPQPWEDLVEEPEETGGGNANAQKPENGKKIKPEDKKKDEEKETDYSNESAAAGKREKAFARAVGTQFDELLGRLRALEKTGSEEEFLNAVRELETDFPEMERRILTRNDVAETIAETIIAQIETESGNGAADFRNVIDKNGMNHDERGRFAPKGTSGGAHLSAEELSAEEERVSESLRAKGLSPLFGMQQKVKAFAEKNLDTGTYDVETGAAKEYADGYQVSFTRPNIDKELNAREYDLMANKVSAKFGVKPDFGVYKPEPPEPCSNELSYHVKSRKEALALAREFNQDSILDWRMKNRFPDDPDAFFIKNTDKSSTQEPNYNEKLKQKF